MQRSDVTPFVLIVLALAVVSGAVAVVPGYAGVSGLFGYTSADDQVPPVDWGEISDTCLTGKRQSPIAISTSDANRRGESAPEMDYGTSDLTVFNNGHTIEAEVHDGAGGIVVNGKSYDLLQFHIHYGSEHMINGNIYFAEIHLVHSGVTPFRWTVERLDLRP